MTEKTVFITNVLLFYHYGKLIGCSSLMDSIWSIHCHHNCSGRPPATWRRFMLVPCQQWSQGQTLFQTTHVVWWSGDAPGLALSSSYQQDIVCHWHLVQPTAIGRFRRRAQHSASTNCRLSYLKYKVYWNVFWWTMFWIEMCHGHHLCCSWEKLTLCVLLDCWWT